MDQAHKPDLLMKNLVHLYRSQPVTDIGLLYPDVPMIVGNMAWEDVVRQVMLLRDYTNFRFIDDLTIADSILQHIKVAVICGGEFYRKATLEALKQWVEQGGLLVAYNMPSLRAVEDNTDYLSALFNPQGGERSVGQGASLYISQDPIAGVPKAERRPRSADPVAGMLAEQPALVNAYQTRLFDLVTAFLTAHGLTVADGVLDGIYTAQLSDRLLVLNTHLQPQQKEVVLPSGKRVTLSLEANSITPVNW
jgi:hypothetical protein